MKDFKVGRDKVVVSLLQYADGAILFLEFEDIFCNTLLLMHIFHRVSGLSINLRKVGWQVYTWGHMKSLI